MPTQAEKVLAFTLAEFEQVFLNERNSQGRPNTIPQRLAALGRLRKALKVYEYELRRQSTSTSRQDAEPKIILDSLGRRTSARDMGQGDKGAG